PGRGGHGLRACRRRRRWRPQRWSQRRWGRRLRIHVHNVRARDPGARPGFSRTAPGDPAGCDESSLPGSSRLLAGMITVDGRALTIDAVVRAAREREAVTLDPEVRVRMRPAREVVDRLDREGAIAYGVTTGFGALADRAVDPADRALLQR